MRIPLALITLAFAGGALAKLPPPAPEAAAAAAAAKDKAAWTDKVAAYKLCLVQDRIAKQYLKTKEGAKQPTVETPPCTDPGPYVPGSAVAAAPSAGTAPAAAPANPSATPVAAAAPAAPAASAAPAAKPAAAAPASPPAPAAAAAAPAKK